MSFDTKNLRYPTEYNLKTLNLITPLTGGVINLKPLLLEMSLFEDIYSSTTSGEVILSDALGLPFNFALNGTEYIEIKLEKMAQDPFPISRNFRVYKIKNRSTSDSNNYEVYSIAFCSEEFFLSEQYRLSKSYPGKKISYIINDILTNNLKVGKGNTKQIHIEETSGVYDFILPNKKIFETINWLSSYAMPASNKPGADMLFFENSQGYWFNSLQTLYKQPSATTYSFDPKNIGEVKNGQVQPNLNQQTRNAYNFEILDYFDTLNATTNGAFSNRVISIDPLQRTFKISDFNYNDYAGKSTKLNKYPLTNNYKNRISKTLYDAPPKDMEAGTLRLVVSNSNQKKHPYIASKPDAVANDIFVEKFLPNRVAQLALANYMRIKLTVAGDPQIMVGKTVDFITYAPTGENLERVTDKFYSGKYLVTAVRHIIKVDSYITVVELSKDSVGFGFPGYSNVAQDYVKGIQKK